MSALRVVRSLTKVASTVGNYGTKVYQRQARLVECARCYSISTKIDPEDPRTIPEKEWKKRLTPEQYAVAREKRTEPPYTGLYVNNYENGMYVCICCGEKLFSSETKYNSHTGWPSFFESYGTKDGDEKCSNVLRRHDNSGGMTRTEVLCKKCDSHLGHVFDDGPPPTGKRFCVNSMSLLFKPENS